MKKARDILSSSWFLIVLLAGILVFFGAQLDYLELLASRPCSIHQWRQTDGASIALTYYQDGNSFFEPAMHNQLGDNGKAGGELPITYYLAAQLYRLFGPHDFFLRWLHFSIFIVGIIMLFRSLVDALSIKLLAFVPIMLFLSSPMLIFYAGNFLPDGPSLGLCLIGSSILMKYLNSGKPRDIYLSAGVISLSGLLKVSMVVPFLAFFIVALVGLAWKGNSRNFKWPTTLSWKQLINAGLILILPLIIWYGYIIWYNGLHSSTYFRTHPGFFWTLPGSELIDVLSTLKNVWLKKVYPKSSWLIYLVSITVLIFNYSKRPAGLNLFVFVLVIGYLTYYSMFFDLLKEHDYYQITVLPLGIVIVGVVIIELDKRLVKLKSRWITFSSLVVLGILTWRVADSARKTFKNQYMGIYMKNKAADPALYSLEPFLNNNGIGRESKVVSLPDESTNRTLYFMNRKGWTGLSSIYNSVDLDSIIKLGAEYAIISDTSFYSINFLQNHITDTVGYHGNIGVYKIGESQ